MGDQDIEEMEEEDMKKELLRQYTKHNEEVMGAVEEGVVRCKIVIVGAEGTGKTSFMNRLTKHQFTPAQSPTVGSAYFLQGVAIEDVEYNFDIWDVSGNLRYATLVPMFAEACVVVYDVTRPETFENAKELVENVYALGEKELVVVLVGTKADMIDELGEGEAYVTEEEAQEYANTKLITVYPMCSAKSGESVEDVMLDIAESVHERRTKGKSTVTLEAFEDEREDPYEFATRARTLTRPQGRRRDSVYEDINERFTGCLSCLNACFEDTVSKTQEISKRAAVKTREAFQSMSEQVDQSTKNARKSLKIDWKVKKRTAANRQASLIVLNTSEDDTEIEREESIKKPYKPVVTVAPLKG